mmetsp:Transcript_55582/g.180301  ORF Transcript_55582/g.180301 Transcript_55582/m.180301 type:complete len:89 (-) Transcript_55582:222-488(-)
MHGFRHHFRRPMRVANIFDATLVFLDLLQLVMVLFLPDLSTASESLPSSSMFRIIRLLKLARLLRLLRNEVFKVTEMHQVLHPADNEG